MKFPNFHQQVLFPEKVSMPSSKSRLKRIAYSLALAGCMAASLPAIALAQGLPGLTIFSGIDRGNQLNYRLDFNGIPSRIDRYRLNIPANKLDLAVAQVAVTYPESYRGTFDTRRMEIRINGESVPLAEVNWDRENRLIELFPEEPIPARTNLELVFSQVRNPRRVGTHYFNALVRSPGDVLAPQYIGTWILSIGGN